MCPFLYNKTARAYALLSNLTSACDRQSNKRNSVQTDVSASGRTDVLSQLASLTSHPTIQALLRLAPVWIMHMGTLLVGCLTSQQQASVSQGRICSDNFTCCHTEIEVADQTFYLTQSQYTDTGLTSPSADPIMPGAWQGSHWSANV